MKVFPGRALGAFAWLVLASCSGSRATERTCSLGGNAGGEPTFPMFDGGAAGSLRILVYSYSNGYRHSSIPDGINTIRALGAVNGFAVDVQGTEADALGSYCANQPTTSPPTFTAELLSQYGAVVFLNTTTTADGTLLDDAGKLAFESYIRAGGGFVGLHAAADADYGWAFYHELLGATFLAHGPPVTASLRIEDVSHPATSALPNPWSRFDEWYDFTASPRATAHVLIDLDETTYPNNPAPMGDHPIAWCKTIGAGRSFYTGLGHEGVAFGDADVRRHLLGGVLYAAGILSADCSAGGSP